MEKSGTCHEVSAPFPASDQRILDAEARQIRRCRYAALEHLRDGPRHVKHLSAGHRPTPFGDRGLGDRRGLAGVAIGGQRAANGRSLGHGGGRT